jgi:hypothetical protein
MNASISVGRRLLRLRRRFARPMRFAGAASVAVLAMSVLGALGGLAVGAYHLLNGAVTSVGHGSGAGPELAAGAAAVALVVVGVFAAGGVERHPLRASALLLFASGAGYADFSMAWLPSGVAFGVGAALAIVVWVRGIRRSEAPPWSVEHWR